MSKHKKPPRKNGAENTKRIKYDRSNLVVVPIKTHKDKKGGHPHVIIDNIDDKHVSVGILIKRKKVKIQLIMKWKVSLLADLKSHICIDKVLLTAKNLTTEIEKVT